MTRSLGPSSGWANGARARSCSSTRFTGFNKAQQDALLPAVENGLIVFVGATTENPYFEVNPPLLSRSTLFRLQPLDEEAVHALLQRGLQAEQATIEPDAGRSPRRPGRWRWPSRPHQPRGGGGPGHRAGRATRRDPRGPPKPPSTPGPPATDATSTTTRSAPSSRASGDPTPTPGLYWLARMLEAGEDARFIARRLVILASEDVGMADSMGLVVADAAARAVEFVGLPEAQLNLAHAVVYLATAPKSNRVTTAIGRARDDARNKGGEVPVHLRDAHYQGAKSLGHGAGYEYPHDHPSGWVDQQYRPRRSATTCTTSLDTRRRARSRRPAAPDEALTPRRERARPPVSATDLAIVIVSVVALASAGVVVALALSFRRAVGDLRTALEQVNEVAVPAAQELAASAERVEADLDRAGGLLDAAEIVSARADTLSKVTYRALADPVIRTAAVIKGTSTATRRLRRGSSPTDKRAG